jgi:GMP synthase (glutamine-hydrolysing)
MIASLYEVLRTQGQVVEPLKLFHEDEVRQLGIDLGLPTALVACHPFAGPGLAVRILCADEPYREGFLRNAGHSENNGRI